MAAGLGRVEGFNYQETRCRMELIRIILLISFIFSQVSRPRKEQIWLEKTS